MESKCKPRASRNEQEGRDEGQCGYARRMSANPAKTLKALARFLRRAFKLLHLRDNVDRGGKTLRQAGTSHCGADMFPSFSKDLDQKIRSPVHDESLPVKVLSAVDQAMDGDNLLEMIE